MTATAPTLSRTPRQTLRRARGWIVLVVILVVGAGIAAAIQLSLAATSADPMGASNPGQQGGQALARVLAQHGVDVRAVGTLSEARRAAAARGDTTVLLSDPNTFLNAAQLRSVLGMGTDLVAVDPRFNELSVIAPDVSQGGRPTAGSSLDPGCTSTAAVRAASVAGVREAYRVSADATGCFDTGSGYALAQTKAQTDRDDTTVSVVGPGLFDNANIGRAGNASLAIGLLGGHRTLVWYLPTAADVRASGAPTLAGLTPGWLTPAIILLIAVVVAAAVWRGRRFGPLVIEDLPVVVRSGETMHGRARLYRTASARTHALDSMRMSTLRRIGELCGLPQHSHVDQLAAAAAALSGWPPQEVRDVLLDSTPQTDAAMLVTASRLADLERDVRRAVRGDATGR